MVTNPGITRFLQQLLLAPRFKRAFGLIEGIGQNEVLCFFNEGFRY